MADVEPIIACSASAVTPSRKSSINTNRKFTTRFPMSLRWSISIVRCPSAPKGRWKTKMSKIWTISYDNSETLRYEIGCQLLLITNRKLRTGFRLVLTSMTLNNLERRNSHYFALFSPNSIAVQTDYIRVFEDRSIIFVKYCLSVSVFHFWPKLTHTAAQSFCDS